MKSEMKPKMKAKEKQQPKNKQDKQYVKLSKFLSLVLRHNPQTIGMTLDDNGWVSVDELICQMGKHGKAIDFATLEDVVNNNNKQRFAFNEDKSKIRANQGHSLTVDLGYQSKLPAQVPSTLYHGTATRFVDNIYAVGAISKMQRQHVHLSANLDTASAVGKRHGKLAIFTIDTQAMMANGHKFYQADNGVWLTDSVPVQFIQLLKDPY